MVEEALAGDAKPARKQQQRSIVTQQKLLDAAIGRSRLIDGDPGEADGVDDDRPFGEPRDELAAEAADLDAETKTTVIGLYDKAIVQCQNARDLQARTEAMVEKQQAIAEGLARLRDQTMSPNDVSVADIGTEQAEQALAAARITRSESIPQVNAGLNAQRSQQNFLGFPIPSAGDGPATNTTSIYGLSADLSWELDVWGRIDRQIGND